MSMLVRRLVLSNTPTVSSWSALDLLTRTPWAWTCAGMREMAVWTWFWTWTWAMSGLVPLAKTAVTLADPREDEDELK
jgi:hypothetical protein